MEKPAQETLAAAPARAQELTRLGLLAVACLLIFNALLVLPVPLLYSGYEHSLTYPENEIAWSAWRAGQGLPLYSDWQAWPHRFTQYGPALYYPVGWTARLLGFDSFSMAYYTLGRAQSMVYLAAMAIAALLLARSAGAQPACSAVCVIGFLALWPMLLMSVDSFRPDTPLVFWTMLGLWLALKFPGRAGFRALALLCFALSALYKPSGWAAPLAAAFVFWKELGPRKTLLWLGGSLLLFLAALLLYDASTGWLFSKNLVQGSAVGYSFRKPWQILADSQNPALVARFALLPVFGIWLFLQKRRPLPQRAIGLYFFLSALLTLAQMGKLGSDLHYLLEPYALVGVAAAIVCQEGFGSASSTRRLSLAALWTGGVLFLVVPVTARLRYNVYDLRHVPKVVREVIPLEKQFQLPPNTLLMDNAFLATEESAHAIPDPLFYAIMTNRGRIAREPFLERLRAQSFPLIIISPVAQQAFFEQARGGWIRHALEQSYHLLAAPSGSRDQFWAPTPRTR